MDVLIEIILKELYLNATPSVDYNQIDKTFENWYLGYQISAKKELEIVEKHLKGKRLSKLTKQAIRNTVYSLAPKNS